MPCGDVRAHYLHVGACLLGCSRPARRGQAAQRVLSRRDPAHSGSTSTWASRVAAAAGRGHYGPCTLALSAAAWRRPQERRDSGNSKATRSAFWVTSSGSPLSLASGSSSLASPRRPVWQKGPAPPRMAPTQTLRGAPFTEEGGHPQRSPWPARHSCYQLSAGAPTPGAGRRARVAPYNNMQIAPLTLNFR